MNVAFIPVRGGSKSIPLKNIKLLRGKPLVYWTVKAACECQYIDRVYVSTDSEVIRTTVESFKDIIDKKLYSKIYIVGRSPESASDTATTESAMLEFANAYNFDNMVLIQATSPLLVADELNRGFAEFTNKDVDSVLSIVKQKRFNWENDENGYAHPINYNVYQRPRRQEFKGYMVENGAFYITSKKSLLQSKNRISGNIKAVEMNEASFFEIDEPNDWIIIETLMNKAQMNKLEFIQGVKLFLTDCDGCLTDGGMYYSEYGDEMKKFNTKDGMGFKLLKELGILTGILTGENVGLNRRRSEKLHLDIYESGCKDKASVIHDICKKRNISLDNVIYIGDDVNDIEAMKLVGFSCCPADAIQPVNEIADYVATTKGGEGVIREIVELTIKAQKKWKDSSK